MAASESDWVTLFAAALEVDPPTAAEREQLLGLAGVAAHASERTSAPLSCWLVARAGISPEAALELARGLAERAGD